MEFEHVRIDDRPPCGRLGFCLTPDLTGNGLPDILVGGMGRAGRINAFGKRLKLRELPIAETIFQQLESNVFWYENPGWKRHDVATAPDLSVGGSCGDLDGDGDPELVIGQNNGTSLYWFDPPSDPRRPWKQYCITEQFRKYHDTAVRDIDGDGEDEVILLSQESEVVAYFDVPRDPTMEPWPDSHLHILAEDLLVEGIAVSDVNGDGQVELIAGPNVFSRHGSADEWDRRPIDGDWEWTRIAVGDIDADGHNEIVMTEGDLPYHGDRRGRLGIVDTQTWDVDVIDSGLFCPHTIQLGDVTGNGRIDLVVGEMSIGEFDQPRLLLYRNDGADGFRREEVHVGVSTHEAKLVDLNGNGQLDIAGKSYGPPAHVDAWLRQS